MCGLAGICDFSGAPVAVDQAVRMADTLVHRGPDASGSFAADHIALAHQRLAIRDLSVAGNQPLHSNDGQITVAYNGELYNEATLRAAVSADSGYHFTSRCDTEVIPAAYLAWGDAAFQRFNGMFALALWDARTGTLLLVRDPIGQKPLFYTRCGDALLFASEIKALLLALPTPPAIDPDALHEYLALGHCAPDRSYLQGIAQVPPGHVLRFDRTGLALEPMSRPKPGGHIRDLDTAISAFTELFPQVVEDHLIADTPVASFQSGGVDSSLINYALRAPDVTLVTAASDNLAFDESSVARQVAADAERPHLEIPSTTGDIPGTFDRVLHHVDGQLADSSAIAVDALSHATARHFKVALAGDGADELFAGYSTYRASRIASCTGGWFPDTWADALAASIDRVTPSSAARYPAAQLAGRFLSGWARGRTAHAVWRRYLSPRDSQHLYTRDLAPFQKVDPLARYAARLSSKVSADTLVQRCLAADLRFYLPGDMLMKVDALSMAHSLEVRLPFLDPRIVDLATQLDSALLCPWLGPTKPILRASLKRLGGPPGLAQRRKTGFNVPVATLLRHDLAEICHRHFDAEADRTGRWLEPTHLQHMWRQHRDGVRDHGYALWALLTFTRWYAGIAP